MVEQHRMGWICHSLFTRSPADRLLAVVGGAAGEGNWSSAFLYHDPGPRGGQRLPLLSCGVVVYYFPRLIPASSLIFLKHRTARALLLNICWLFPGPFSFPLFLFCFVLLFIP